MSRRVLVLQPDPKSAQAITDYFARQGDQVWKVTTAAQAKAALAQKRPTLALLDLQAPGNATFEVLAHIRSQNQDTRIIITSKDPDVRSELLAKTQGARVFLRAPFTPAWIERAMAKLETGEPGNLPVTDLEKKLPKVRVSMRVKITLPYILLAVAFLLASAYLVSRYILDSIQERFTNQLIDAGKLTGDWMVQEENRLLSSERLLANIDGIAEAVSARDAEKLRMIALPLAINSKEEAVEILDAQGSELLSLRHQPGGAVEAYDASQGDALFTGLPFAQKVIQAQADALGDKFAGVVKTSLGDTFYVAGPIAGADGKLVGAVLVGKTLETIARQMRQESMAQLTIYNLNGDPLTSTLFLKKDIFPITNETVQAVMQRQDQQSSIRDLKVASVNYSEILGPWEARGGEDLGVLGIAMAQNFFVRPNTVTSFQAALAIALAFLGILLIGIMMARQITQPLAKIIAATTEVAKGNLKIKVPANGNDEIMVLAHAFNYMVAGLQEGSIYHDLLGRTVSPEVRSALRQSFASGGLRLEGHNAVATVLISDIRNFTALSEKEPPTTILEWLNEYFGELVPIITSHGGVVDKFEGDAVLAFFGILPTPLSPQESAANACQAAVEMLAQVELINERRQERSEPPLRTGIGVNTGTLIAGGLGTSDRLNYTVIGDTVNTTERMQELTRDFGDSGVVVGETTLTALQGRRGEFRFEPLGEHVFKGKSELLWVYRLWPFSKDRHSNNGFNKDLSSIDLMPIKEAVLPGTVEPSQNDLGED